MPQEHEVEVKSHIVVEVNLQNITTIPSGDKKKHIYGIQPEKQIHIYEFVFHTYIHFSSEF